MNRFPWAILLVLSLNIMGCVDPQPPKPPQPDIWKTAIESEIDDLFSQKYIDPLTNYVKTHERDPSRKDAIQRVRIEIGNRCQKIAKRFKRKPKTKATLAKLKAGYQYSCSRIVDEFAKIIPRYEEKSSQYEANNTQCQYPSVKDVETSITLCEPLAYIGNTKAQLVLSKLYRDKDDKIWAFVWASFATTLSDDSQEKQVAAKFREDIRSNFTPQERKEAADLLLEMRTKIKSER